ncbi:alpha/beta hydrolase [Caulobacter sp. D4A]|uniref:alpha/beta fold hydrolase n=1 Tax=unclassified Caulobacter TaxID=2648921 RepID=UPI000D731807|nr:MULTISPECIES: alpha/beta hydrolase [unclassified Caulobacter]PXA82578.1 alpha/beta hydrolase [Caulobacter sp. D5]PXA95208.1 alpha/beta hydrolase [Caulobacter sp. D4A]
MSKTALAFALAFSLTGVAAQAAPPAAAKPTIVLVHGAFADSSSWDGVVADLTRDGYHVVAAANPLRGAASDAAAVRTVINSIPGPVVLVGHSYGGTVISAAADGAANVKGLVYVAAFAPEVGESTFDLAGKFPGGTLGEALDKPVDLPGGAHDLYIRQDRFPAQFAADVPLAKARLMAIAQRPLTDAAGAEKAVATAWKTIPSWWVYGEADRNIPPAAMAWMAKRANARQVVTVPGASHVVMISHPHAVSALIETAAR